MDVILLSGGINWSIPCRSIGPYKIAHWIRKNGYSCQVIDFVDKFSEEQIFKLIEHFVTTNTSIIGISTTFLSDKKYTDGNTTSHIPIPLLNVLKHFKIKYPKIKFIIGGYASDKISNHGLLDATIMSYSDASEDIFIEYLDYLKKNTSPPKFILADSGRKWFNQANKKVYDIEKDDFKFVTQDCILPGEPLPLDISRGCIFACRFCQYPHLGKQKLDYIRGMEYLEAELIENYNNFKTTTYYVLDDTFNDTEEKLKAFNAMTKRLPFKINFMTYLRADLLHRFPDMTYLLQDSGLFGAYFGIESLHPEASKIVAKGWNGKHARDYIPKLYHDIWKNNIPVHTNFIVGLPGEPESSIQSTVDWHKSNDLHSIEFALLHILGPNKNTMYNSIESEFDKNYEKYGFTFEFSEKHNKYLWKNDQWDVRSARAATNKFMEQVRPYRKSHPWTVPGLMWAGYDKETLKHEKLINFSASKIDSFAKNIYNEYYDKMLSL